MCLLNAHLGSTWRCLARARDRESSMARSTATLVDLGLLAAHQMVCQSQFLVETMKQSTILRSHQQLCLIEICSRPRFVARQDKRRTLSSVECSFGIVTAGLRPKLSI